MCTCAVLIFFSHIQWADLIRCYFILWMCDRSQRVAFNSIKMKIPRKWILNNNRMQLTIFLFHKCRLWLCDIPYRRPIDITSLRQPKHIKSNNKIKKNVPWLVNRLVAKIVCRKKFILFEDFHRLSVRIEWNNYLSIEKKKCNSSWILFVFYWNIKFCCLTVCTIVRARESISNVKMQFVYAKAHVHVTSMCSTNAWCGIGPIRLMACDFYSRSIHFMFQ